MLRFFAHIQPALPEHGRAALSRSGFCFGLRLLGAPPLFQDALDMHVLRDFVPPYDVAALVVDEDRIRGVLRVALRIVALLFYHGRRIMADVVAALGYLQPPGARSVSRKRLLVLRYLRRRSLSAYYSVLALLLKTVVHAAHLLYIRQRPADASCRKLDLVFAPWLEQDSFSVPPRLHHGASDRAVSRLSEVAAHSVLGVRPSRGDADLYVSKRRSREDSRMCPFQKVRHDEPLPVEIEVVF